MGDASLREALALVKQGIPFDVAFSLDNDTRVAWLIICGEQDGFVFDWEIGEFTAKS